MKNVSQTRPTKQYRVYLVRPVGDFSPRNWQEKPERFAIIAQLFETPFLGTVDAKRFLINHDSIESGDCSRWAVALS